MTRWIIEGEIDDRWPINTRGNVGEVFPEVVTPLTYELGIKTAEAAWREAYLEIGVGAPSDFTRSDPVIIGLYSGYTYLDLSYLRIMGVRAPGSSAEAIDVAFFGEGTPPPYEPRKGDKNLRSSAKILRTVMKALNTKELPPIVKNSFQKAAIYEDMQPSLDAEDQILFDYLMQVPMHFKGTFHNHMISSAIAAIVSGILIDACAAAGKPGLVTHLIGAAGDVRSASYSQDLYAIAQITRSTPSVNDAFDAGTSGLLERLKALPDAELFLAQFDTFLSNHGHRGPNDWELSSRTWDNTPELALIAINAMRHSEDDLSPGQRLVNDEDKRQRAIEVVRPHVSGLDRVNFDKAVKAIPYWTQAREATRDRAVRATFPAKRVYRELVRRAAERGGDPDPVHVALLYPHSELAAYIANPATHMATIEERAALHDRYTKVTPRFFITSQAEVPTLEELEAVAAEPVPAVTAGSVLQGDAGSSGTATGKVRVVLDPIEAGDLRPGEVLVAPLTDPSWTPLFLPAAAVVVNVGALMSHAVIVARELGIPCVVAVEGATDQLRDGMTVEVDGTLGTVTVVDPN